MSAARESLTTSWAGRRVTVMGLGHFGGGIGAVRFLTGLGASVTVTDLKPETELADSLAAIRHLPLASLRLGEHRDEDFTSADLVVASPAVRPDHPCLTAARRCGVEVTTEIALFWRFCPARVIGVTGTIGKSTTAALIHHLLAASGRRVWLGGNIGGSLLDDLSNIQPDDWVVLELSSFQLSYLDAEGRSPQIAVVTSFAPNHLDWHRSLDEYRAAKQTVLRYQREEDAAILPADPAEFGRWPGAARQIEFGASQHAIEGVTAGPAEIVLSIGDTSARIALAPNQFPTGAHQRLDAAAAIAAAVVAGVSPDECQSALAAFRGLPHRLEFLGVARERRFYNDSKATTPEAAIAALRAFDQPVVLLAGGSDKGVDLAPLGAEIRSRAKAVALMGETAPAIARQLGESLRTGAGPSQFIAPDFPAAFRWALSQSAPGDVILLSPGCASFGWFRDYEDRGEQFRRAVDGLRHDLA